MEKLEGRQSYACLEIQTWRPRDMLLHFDTTNSDAWVRIKSADGNVIHAEMCLGAVETVCNKSLRRLFRSINR